MPSILVKAEVTGRHCYPPHLADDGTIPKTATGVFREMIYSGVGKGQNKWWRKSLDKKNRHQV
jgi:hypothetical protein